MLHTLNIRDLALIEHAELSFHHGFNVLSGETGGGKSLVIAAMELLRGGRSRADLVRHGARELRVDGEFRVGGGGRWSGVFEVLRDTCGIDLEGEELIVTRIVDAKGRSKARVNGYPVTVTALRELGAWLLEIHGQGESRALMRPEIQCETLDAFAGTGTLRHRFAAALGEARRTRQHIEEGAGGERERQARAEFLRYQLGEMTALDVRPGELAELDQEHRILAHSDRMRELLESALDALQERDASALDLLHQAGRALDKAAQIDRELADAAALVAEASVGASEASRAIQHGLARVDADPTRLAAVEGRLAELRRALQRFGPTEADFTTRMAAARTELDELSSEAFDPIALAARLAEETATVAQLGGELTEARRAAAERFTAAVEQELASLGMPSTELRVSMAEQPAAERLLDEATAYGPGSLDFTVRVNPGEPPKSLRETASGGEMARLVLSIKKCLADQDRVPFLVFDEIDAEIGGRLGLQVGRKLREVAAHHQLLIVTHLPQVAAFGDAHFKVHKSTDKKAGRTISAIEKLGRAAAERELAAMSVGEDVDQKAIRAARRMVEQAQGG
ncbi:MAG: DNA repair protein RecN [Planctomycetes bacterium]|nr:DNA repair protein RecN [Planctomycetota bacterium]MCB9869019.1 DNA repair protein RecN [Planctomycetota bacterium]MCB9887979.1 DNA repair protein RecN [Planctomycetota bacterium]